MSVEIVYLTTAPNEPMAGFWQSILEDAGIPVLVQPLGAGFGAWGSSSTLEHRLSVRADDLIRAQELLAAETDGAWDEE
jgi:putative signal transducing protein